MLTQQLYRDSGIEESTLRPLAILAEILVGHPMPSSVGLMSAALDTLTRVFDTHSSQSDANYIMQLLMSVLESIATSTSVSGRCIHMAISYLYASITMTWPPILSGWKYWWKFYVVCGYVPDL